MITALITTPIVVVIVIVAGIVLLYNSLVELQKNRAKNSFSQIDVQLKRRLAPQHLPRTRPTRIDASLGRGAARTLIAGVAHHGNRDSVRAAQSYQAGMYTLFGEPNTQLDMPQTRPVLAELDRALTALASATGTQRQRVVEACAAAVMADGEISANEGEILRAVADGLGCPLPPFVPTEQTIES